MVTLRSAKHQQLMFPLKNSVSKVKRCNISFTNPCEMAFGIPRNS